MAQRAMFREWFEVTVCSVAFDTVGEAVNLERE